MLRSWADVVGPGLHRSKDQTVWTSLGDIPAVGIPAARSWPNIPFHNIEYWVVWFFTWEELVRLHFNDSVISHLAVPVKFRGQRIRLFCLFAIDFFALKFSLQSSCSISFCYLKVLLQMKQESPSISSSQCCIYLYHINSYFSIKYKYNKQLYCLSWCLGGTILRK